MATSLKNLSGSFSPTRDDRNKNTSDEESQRIIKDSINDLKNDLKNLNSNITFLEKDSKRRLWLEPTILIAVIGLGITVVASALTGFLWTNSRINGISQRMDQVYQFILHDKFNYTFPIPQPKEQVETNLRPISPPEPPTSVPN